MTLLFILNWVVKPTPNRSDTSRKQHLFAANLKYFILTINSLLLKKLS